MDKPLLAGQIAGAALLADGDWVYRVRVTREAQASLTRSPMIGDSVCVVWLEDGAAVTAPAHGGGEVEPPSPACASPEPEPIPEPVIEILPDALEEPRVRGAAERLYSGGWMYLRPFWAFVARESGLSVWSKAECHEAMKSIYHLGSLADLSDAQAEELKVAFLKWKRERGR